jgi:hypothetical protein
MRRLVLLVLLRPLPLPPELFLLIRPAGRWLRRLVLLLPPPAAGLLVSRPAGRWRRRPLAPLLPLALLVVLVWLPIARACALA